MSLGWKPTLKGPTKDKCSYLFAVMSALAAAAALSAWDGPLNNPAFEGVLSFV